MLKKVVSVIYYLVIISYKNYHNCYVLQMPVNLFCPAGLCIIPTCCKQCLMNRKFHVIKSKFRITHLLGYSNMLKCFNLIAYLY